MMRVISVSKKTVTKKLSEQEAYKIKSHPYISTARQNAKGINFGFLFGLKASSFANMVLKLYWKEQQIDEYIKNRNLQDKVEELVDKLINSKYKKYESLEEVQKEAKYLTVATDIRNKFFSLYKGFEERIKRNIEIGEKTGFIKAVNGSIRRLPLLLLMTEQDDNKLRAEYHNILSNTTIQNDEACKALLSIARIMEKWKKNHQYKKGYIFSTIHDSIDFYIHKDHLQELLKDIVDIIYIMEDWQKGIELPIEAQIVDLTEKDNYYKHGKSLPISK